MRWIRLEVAFDETWLFPLTPASQLAWVKLLCTAKRDGVRGVLKYLSPAVASRKWSIPESDVQAMYDAAIQDEAIEVTVDHIKVCNWLQYQPLDKTAAQRQKKHRDTSKDSHGKSRKVTPLRPVTPDVTVGHGLSQEKRRYVDVDVDAYTDVDKEKEISPRKTRGAKFDAFPTTDSDRFYRVCIENGFAVNMGILRKAIAPLYPQTGQIYTTDELANALVAWLEARQGLHPDKARFWTLHNFAQDVARWVRLGKMPLANENGVTERGRLAVGE
jgi:hypothetical protein